MTSRITGSLDTYLMSQGFSRLVVEDNSSKENIGPDKPRWMYLRLRQATRSYVPSSARVGVIAGPFHDPIISLVQSR